MMRRTLTQVLVLATLSVFAPSVGASTFSDTVGTPYESAFSYLSEHNVVEGYEGGQGRPEVLLNRAEALKVIMSLREDLAKRVALHRKYLPPIPLFIDMDQSAWYAPYVETAFERGVVQGYPDGTLRPDQLVRTEEAIALLMRLYGEGGEEGTAILSEYIENQSDQWWTPYVNRSIEKNLIMHIGRMRPGTAITRGQFFDIAYRMHTVNVHGLDAFDGPEPQPIAVRTVVSAPQRITSMQGGGSVTTSTQSISLPQYASEKHFAISMPSLGVIDLAVNHPSDPFSNKGVLAPLEYGVGHLFSYPGGGGKIMIYGHSSGYPWDISDYTKIFRRVNELSEGDKIYVTYDGELHIYEVAREQTIDASDTRPFNDNGAGEELILYTCWPPDSIAQRYLIHAYPVKTMALR